MLLALPKTFVAPLPGSRQSRSRGAVAGRKEYETAVRWLLRGMTLDPAKRYEVSVEIGHPDWDSRSETPPDATNILKSVEDATMRALEVDDRNNVKVSAEKVNRAEKGVRVTIREAGHRRKATW